MSARKLLILATEDWFVRSHFSPLLRRALTEGFEVVVAARDSGALLDTGVRVASTPFARGSLKPWEVGAQVLHLRALLRAERPDVIHVMGLKPIVVLILSAHRAAARVFAVTGRGYLAIGRAPWTRFVSRLLQHMLRRALGEARTLLLVENDADRQWAGVGQDRALLMPGAGVDPAVFTAAPEPSSSPIIVGVVARLVWSKGIDLAVAAIQRLRGEGVDVTLRIAGAIDPENPERVTPEELARWRGMPGVELVGAKHDINAFWADTHISCLPSRGGEGLPRSMLEAASCGRPVVTTDAPGCGDFVLHGETGFVCPREDVDALTAALRLLADDANLRARMGAGGRARVVNGYTEAHAAEQAARAWRTVLQV